MATMACSGGILAACRLMLASAMVLVAGLIPAFGAEPLTVTVNQSRLVKLQHDADIIMIGNPTIADIAVESTRMFFLLGIEPGETSLHILDSQGDTVLQTSIVVVPTEERTVTVNRANDNVEATYSCSPRCAEVGTAVGTGASAPTGGGDNAGEAGADPAAPAVTGTGEGATTGAATGG